MRAHGKRIAKSTKSVIVHTFNRYAALHEGVRKCYTVEQMNTMWNNHKGNRNKGKPRPLPHPKAIWFVYAKEITRLLPPAEQPALITPPPEQPTPIQALTAQFQRQLLGTCSVGDDIIPWTK